MVDALLPKTRRAILGLLFQHPEKAFYQRQIMRAAGGGRGAVQRELDSLTKAGIVHREMRGDRAYYSANEACPIFPELRGLVLKTVGLVDVLAAGLRGLRGVRVAFVYGSFARGDADATSDVDLLVLGNVSFADMSRALRRAEEHLAREINPTVYSVPEFREKLGTGHHFVTRVLSGEKLFVVGDADELEAMAGRRLDEAPPV